MAVRRSVVVRYNLDTSQSTFTVQAFSAGLLAGLGHNPMVSIHSFKGEAEAASGTLSEASMRLVIDSGSLKVTEGVKEEDRREVETRMLNDVLEAGRYPDIVFQSTNIEVTKTSKDRHRARIIGDLAMHGVTRAGLWIQAQLTVSADSLRAQGEFSLKQTDYKIKLVSFAVGALKIKDELKFNFDILARREQS